MASGRSCSSHRRWVDRRQRLRDVTGRAKVLVKWSNGNTDVHEGQLRRGDSRAFGKGCPRRYMRQVVLGGYRFSRGVSSTMSSALNGVSVVRREDDPLFGSDAMIVESSRLNP